MPRKNISFSYKCNNLDLMAAADAHGNLLFWGARKVRTFKENANLVSSQPIKNLYLKHNNNNQL